MVTRIWKILDLVLFLFGKAIRAVFGDILIFPFAFEVGLSFLVPFKVRYGHATCFVQRNGSISNSWVLLAEVPRASVKCPTFLRAAQ